MKRRRIKMRFEDYESHNMVKREYLGEIAKRIRDFMDENQIGSIQDLHRIEGIRKRYGKEEVVAERGDGYLETSAASIRYSLGEDKIPMKLVFNESMALTKISIKGAYALPDYEAYQVNRLDWVLFKEWDGLDVGKARSELENLEKAVSAKA